MERPAIAATLRDLAKHNAIGKMTIGIDLGDRRSHFCVLNDQGQVIARGFLPTTITAFRRECEVLPPSLVAIEAGTHSLWASQALKVCGHEVLVGNARKIRLITESDRKNDRAAAESLARLARADRLFLAPIQHRTAEKQVELSVIRARHVLVRSRTALINCARGLVKPMGLRLPSCSPEAFGKRVSSTCLPEILREALAPLLKQIEGVNQAIREYDRQIEQIAETQYPETCLLKQIKGVGTLIALTYVLTLQDPHRFARSRDVGAFLGFLPREKQSGERAPRLGISRAGNEYLRSLLVQGAHYILGPLGLDTLTRSGCGLSRHESNVALLRHRHSGFCFAARAGQSNDHGSGFQSEECFAYAIRSEPGCLYWRGRRSFQRQLLEKVSQILGVKQQATRIPRRSPATHLSLLFSLNKVPISGPQTKRFMHITSYIFLHHLIGLLLGTLICRDELRLVRPSRKSKHKIQLHPIIRFRQQDHRSAAFCNIPSRSLGKYFCPAR